MKNLQSPTRYILTILSSLLLFAATPGIWSMAPLMWIALIPLLIASNNLPVKAAARLGFICGLIYNLLIIYWIVIALGRYGGLPIWLSLLALIGLCTYMALYFALFNAVVSWQRLKGVVPLVWLAPITWVALDFVRSKLFSGFPWQDLGYSQFQHPAIVQFADLTGHYGITFIVIMVNALFFVALSKCSKKSRQESTPSPVFTVFILPITLLVAVHSYDLWRYQQLDQEIPLSPTINLGLIQGNIDQGEKWQPSLQEKTVNTYLRLSRATLGKNTDLLIWPETALPFFPTKHPLFSKIKNELLAPGSPDLLTGAPDWQEAEDGSIEYFNSAFFISADRKDTHAFKRYDKQHLVPFGEYIPFEKYLSILPIVQSMGNFSAGNSAAPISSGEAKIGVLICFESIFPELARARTNQGANLLVNITNDAWYGRSSAPIQQLSMATLRAIENRRTLARAANTGISCFIDPLGRMQGASPLFKEYYMVKKMPLYDMLTFYSQYGHLFAPACLLLLSLFSLYGILSPPGNTLSKQPHLGHI